MKWPSHESCYEKSRQGLCKSVNVISTEGNEQSNTGKTYTPIDKLTTPALQYLISLLGRCGWRIKHIYSHRNSEPEINDDGWDQWRWPRSMTMTEINDDDQDQWRWPRSMTMTEINHDDRDQRWRLRSMTTTKFNHHIYAILPEGILVPEIITRFKKASMYPQSSTI
jgi:hypothetical protein